VDAGDPDAGEAWDDAVQRAGGRDRGCVAEDADRDVAKPRGGWIGVAKDGCRDPAAGGRCVDGYGQGFGGPDQGARGLGRGEYRGDQGEPGAVWAMMPRVAPRVAG